MRGRRDAGMVTAELAMVIPAVVMVLAMCLTGLGLALDQLRCADAARVAARAASRGDDPSVVRDLALRLAPDGSAVQVQQDGDSQSVSVTVRAVGRVDLLPGLPRARSTVSAPLEPGAGGGG